MAKIQYGVKPNILKHANATWVNSRLIPTLAKPTLDKQTLAKIGVSVLWPSLSKKTEEQDEKKA